MRTASDSTLGKSEYRSVSLADKVSFLSDPGNYREHPQIVTLLQTHHAWLFMTQQHVFKMKKPLRQRGFDCSTLESRYWLCNEEIRLNRRLAKDTYLDVVPLVFDQSGRMELEGDGCPVEWLVKMARLPDSQMLLHAASHDRVSRVDIQRLMRRLLRFYANTETVDLRSGEYVALLREKVRYWSQELKASQYAHPVDRINELQQLQSSYIDSNYQLLEHRARDGHVRNGHGDLRPEHVFLVKDAEPEIIDCLEFDANLRRLDSAEELAFLAMECRHAGMGSLARECRACYQDEFGASAAPMHLWNFYAALGALVRAGLSAWRISASALDERWQRRTHSYFCDAVHYITLTG